MCALQITTVTSSKFVVAVGGRPRYLGVPGDRELCITRWEEALGTPAHCPWCTLADPSLNPLRHDRMNSDPSCWTVHDFARSQAAVMTPSAALAFRRGLQAAASLPSRLLCCAVQRRHLLSAAPPGQDAVRGRQLHLPGDSWLPGGRGLLHHCHGALHLPPWIRPGTPAPSLRPMPPNQHRPSNQFCPSNQHFFTCTCLRGPRVLGCKVT